MTNRPQKITLGEMRQSGVRGLLIYCADYHCSHWIAVNADQWSDETRLSDLEDRLVCTACGRGPCISGNGAALSLQHNPPIVRSVAKLFLPARYSATYLRRQSGLPVNKHGSLGMAF